jgi:putative alpha-1,2-mannosidase
MPWAYHYANRPDLSALRVRDVLYKNFNTGINGCVFALRPHRTAH